jgi:hypothetical protein
VKLYRTSRIKMTPTKYAGVKQGKYENTLIILQP